MSLSNTLLGQSFVDLVFSYNAIWIRRWNFFQFASLEFFKLSIIRVDIKIFSTNYAMMTSFTTQLTIDQFTRHASDWSPEPQVVLLLEMSPQTASQNGNHRTVINKHGQKTIKLCVIHPRYDGSRKHKIYLRRCKRT